MFHVIFFYGTNLFPCCDAIVQLKPKLRNCERKLPVCVHMRSASTLASPAAVTECVRGSTETCQRSGLNQPTWSCLAPALWRTGPCQPDPCKNSLGLFAVSCFLSSSSSTEELVLIASDLRGAGAPQSGLVSPDECVRNQRASSVPKHMMTHILWWIWSPSCPGPCLQVLGFQFCAAKVNKKKPPQVTKYRGNVEESRCSVKDLKVSDEGEGVLFFIFYSQFSFRPFLQSVSFLPPSGFAQIFSYLEWKQLGWNMKLVLHHQDLRMATNLLLSQQIAFLLKSSYKRFQRLVGRKKNCAGLQSSACFSCWWPLPPPKCTRCCSFSEQGGLYCRLEPVAGVE